MIGDKAFVALRNKLNCLHYCQPLSKESCGLTERLLGDLLATTELYQRTKLRAEKAEGQITHEQIALMPLKKDNARVVKENNSLHQEIITVKENLAQNDNNWQRMQKQLESEYNNIKQALQAKNYKITELETRNLQLENRLDSVMSKAYKQDIRQITPLMVSEENEIGAKQHMELVYQLQKETTMEVRNEDEHNLINQICAADERVQIMSKELSVYRQFKDEAESRIKDLEGMIYQRDTEITRLNNLYMGADNLDKMNIEFIEKENSDTIAKLNSQLDYINKENNRLQQIISDLKCKNKGNTGMYLENKKVVSRIEVLKKENDELRRVFENAQKIIESQNEKENALTTSLLQKHIPKEKFDESLKTIECQQMDIEKLKKIIEIKDNQKKLETHIKIASEESNKHQPQPAQAIVGEEKMTKSEKERLMKKNEQYRNEINALSGKYLGAQRKLEVFHEEYKIMKAKINDLKSSNLMLTADLETRDKEIDVMVDYLKDVQPGSEKDRKEDKENLDDSFNVASFGKSFQ
jgi:centrosomal protein CEP135